MKRHFALGLTTAFALALAPVLGATDAAAASPHAAQTDGSYVVADASGWASDALGTHHVNPGDPMYLPCPVPTGGPSVCPIFKTASEADAAFNAANASVNTPRATTAATVAPDNVGSCPGNAYEVSFNTNVSQNFSTLDARSAPCQGNSTVTGVYHQGDPMSVLQEDDGAQFICRGRSYGYGTSVWYDTNRGWSWAGGTDDPQWNYGNLC